MNGQGEKSVKDWVVVMRLDTLGQLLVEANYDG